MSAASPPSINAAAIVPRWATPINTMIVPPAWASACQLTAVLAALAVTGDDGERRADTTMRHRDACCCRSRDDRRDTGHDLEVEACRSEGEGLLATTSEHERIAAFEPHDVSTAAAELHQQLVDQLLRHGCARALADVDHLGVGSGEREHSGADQRVVHDDVGVLQSAQPTNGQELRVTRTGADQ